MPTKTFEGKQRIFFSRQHSDKHWRLMEKVAAVSELLLQPRDDVLGFSSVRIPNVAGDGTEVDVAYSTLSNPTDYFEFVQVRDRGRTEGRPWLEQVIGQQTSLGITKCRAVSTSSFSEESVRLAENQGIPLRLLRPQTEEEIRKWCKLEFVTINNPLIEIQECRVFTQLEGKPLRLKADSKKSVERNILPHAKEPHTYQDPISLRKVFYDALKRKVVPDLNQFLSELPDDNQFHDVPPVTLRCSPPVLSLRFIPPDGNPQVVPVELIVYTVKACKCSVNAPISYRFKYIDAISDEKLADIVVGEGDVAQVHYYFCFVMHSELGAAVFK